MKLSITEIENAVGTLSVSMPELNLASTPRYERSHCDRADFVICRKEGNLRLTVWFDTENPQRLRLSGIAHKNFRYYPDALSVCGVRVDVAVEQLTRDKKLSDIVRSACENNDQQLLQRILGKCEVFRKELKLSRLAYGCISLDNLVLTEDNYLSVIGLSHMVCEDHARFPWLHRMDLERMQKIIESLSEGKMPQKAACNSKRSSLGYDYVGPFSENVAVVGLNNRYGYVDRDFRLLTPLKYTYADEIAEGYALVKIGERYGAIHKSGREVLACLYEDILQPSENGLFVVSLDGEWWLKELDGSDIQNTHYDQICDFYDDYAPVRTGRKWGLLNRTGELVTPCIYDRISKRTLTEPYFILTLNGHQIQWWPPTHKLSGLG